MQELFYDNITAPSTFVIPEVVDIYYQSGEYLPGNVGVILDPRIPKIYVAQGLARIDKAFHDYVYSQRGVQNNLYIGNSDITPIYKLKEREGLRDNIINGFKKITVRNTGFKFSLSENNRVGTLKFYSTGRELPWTSGGRLRMIHCTNDQFPFQEGLDIYLQESIVLTNIIGASSEIRDGKVSGEFCFGRGGSTNNNSFYDTYSIFSSIPVTESTGLIPTDFIEKSKYRWSLAGQKRTGIKNWKPGELYLTGDFTYVVFLCHYDKQILDLKGDWGERYGSVGHRVTNRSMAEWIGKTLCNWGNYIEVTKPGELVPLGAVIREGALQTLRSARMSITDYIAYLLKQNIVEKYRHGSNLNTICVLDSNKNFLGNLHILNKNLRGVHCPTGVFEDINISNASVINEIDSEVSALAQKSLMSLGKVGQNRGIYKAFSPMLASENPRYRESIEAFIVSSVFNEFEDSIGQLDFKALIKQPAKKGTGTISDIETFKSRIDLTDLKHTISNHKDSVFENKSVSAFIGPWTGLTEEGIIDAVENIAVNRAWNKYQKKS